MPAPEPAIPASIKKDSAYLDFFILKHNTGLDEIVTDKQEILAEFQDYLVQRNITDVRLSFYQDKNCSLMTVYNLPKELTNLRKEKVWMKSGAYLVIEQTEAMTVIDVNTGKSMENKTFEEHLLRINSEAAVEACRQMRLRNLSGIIIIDFINMKQPESMMKIQKIIEQELQKGFRSGGICRYYQIGTRGINQKEDSEIIKRTIAALKCKNFIDKMRTR